MGLFSPVGTLFLSYGGPKLGFWRFLKIFVSAVTFLLFELERSLWNQKRVKKLFFIVKVFAVLEIFIFRWVTAIFVDFGTFFARIFSPPKRSDWVPMAISGENIILEQPLIVYATSSRRPSDPRNRPSKIGEKKLSPFQTLSPYTRSYQVGPGTRNVGKYMPNLSSFHVRGHISRYNHLKTCLKSTDPPKMDPKFWIFCPFFNVFGQENSFLWKNIAWRTIFYVKFGYFRHPIL